jgi:hypothetical protein
LELARQDPKSIIIIIIILRRYIGHYLGITYSDMNEWRTAVGDDNHSLSVYPFFTSLNDPTINQILLNNAGLAIAGIDTDIDGNSRHVSEPDIGAKEYDPCGQMPGSTRYYLPQARWNQGLWMYG